MFKLKQVEITNTITEVANESKPELAFVVTNNHPALEWKDYMELCANVEEDHLTLFGDDHFAEVTETPLNTYRRWDVAQYMLSYGEQDYLVRYGLADLYSRFVKSVYEFKPAGQVVVIFAIGNERNYLTQKFLDNCLGSGCNINKSAMEYLNKQHEADNVAFIPVIEDPDKYEENTSRLFECMMNYGMVREVEDEYVPTEFVVVTESLNYFTGHAPGPEKLQRLLSRGIRFIEYRFDMVFGSGMPVINRTATSGILYFPIRNRYTSASQVKFRNYYVPSSIHKTNFRFSQSLSKPIYEIVPAEETPFPVNTMQSIIYALIEQNMTDPKYNPKYGYNFVFMSTEIDAFEDYHPQFELDIPYGTTITLPSDISMTDLENILKSHKETQTYRYLFVHASNIHTIAKKNVGELLKITEPCGFHLVVMNTHPNETAVYEDTKKFFK